MAKRRNIDVVLPRHLQNRLAPQSTHFLFVDDECFNFHRVTHANTSAGTCMLQTPAGQRLCSMCSIYSLRKYFSVLSTGFGAVCPSPQRLASFTVEHKSSSNSRSSIVPVPSQIRVNSV